MRCWPTRRPMPVSADLKMKTSPPSSSPAVPPGLPKGAQISHRQIAGHLNTVIHDLGRGDVISERISDVSTSRWAVHHLCHHGRNHRAAEIFRPDQVLQLIPAGTVTCSRRCRRYQMLAQTPAPGGGRPSSLRFCTSGGAPTAGWPAGRAHPRQGVHSNRASGRIQSGPGAVRAGPEDAIRKAGSIGGRTFTSCPDRRTDNRPLGPNETGELVLKGPSIASGYFNNAAAWGRGHRRRRLVPHRRFGPLRRGLVFLYRGPAEGHVHLRRRERLPGGNRGGVVPASGGVSMRGGRRAPIPSGARSARRSWCSSRTKPPAPRRCWRISAIAWRVTRFPSRRVLDGFADLGGRQRNVTAGVARVGTGARWPVPTGCYI